MPTQTITNGENTYIYTKMSQNNYNKEHFDIGVPLVETEWYESFLRWPITGFEGKRAISATASIYVESLAGANPMIVSVYATNNDKQMDTITGLSTRPSIGARMGDTSISTTGYVAIPHIGEAIKRYINGDLESPIVMLHRKIDQVWNVNLLRCSGFSSANPPILTIEYEFIGANKPINLSPKSEHVNIETSITLAWEYDLAWSGDAQQAYQLRYSQDAGATFTTVSGTTATSRTFGIGTFADGTVMWELRVQNSNGLWSAWESATFTVTQIRPQRPQSLNPDGIQTAILPTATWTYTPYNESDEPTGYHLQYSTDGGATYTDVTQTTTTMQYAFPSALLGGLIRWRVRVMSSFFGLYSNWSEYALFSYMKAPDAPVITSPTNQSTPMPTIAWTSAGQVAYELQVLDANDDLIWQTGERNTVSKSYKIETYLTDESTYTIRLRIKNAVNLWSELAEQEIYVDFEQTDQPVITLSEDTTKFGVRIQIENPVAVIQNELWRNDGSVWIRIARDITENGSYTDYTIKHDTFYFYRVRAVSDDGYSDSEVQRRKILVTDSQLMSLSDTSIYVPLVWNPSKSESTSIQQSIVSYVGRKYPSVIWGGNESKSLAIKFTIKKEHLPALYQLYERRETLLFRDSRGRKQYVVITGEVSVEDEIPFFELFNVSLRLTVVDHKEAV